MIALLGAAFAVEACMDPVTFRAFVVDAQSALDRGDLPLAEQVLGQFEEKVVCLGYAPEPRLWADLLVVYAIVAYNEGEDWQTPLASALWLRPLVDRAVGRGHPIYDWEAPPRPEGEPLPPIPGNQRVFVDGALSDRLPPAQGWHLVQKTDGTYWDTAFQRGEPLAARWVSDPVEEPVHLEWWIAAHLHAGGMVNWQNGGGGWVAGENEPFSPYYGLPRSDLLGWGFNASGRATLRGIGISGRGATLWNGSPGLRDARFSLIWQSRYFVVGGGVSFADVHWRRTREPMRGNREAIKDDLEAYGPVWETSLQRFLHLEAGWRFGRRFMTEGNVIVGQRSLHSWSGLAEVWFTFPAQGWLQNARPRVGGQATFANARLVLVEAPSLWVDAWVTRVTPSVGLVFGEYE